MKAIVFNTPGDADVLHMEHRDIPKAEENEVLIQVAAAGINRPDIIQRMGKYPAPNGIVQDILGLEVSGIVVKTGGKVNRWKIGDPVMALVPGGGYAEYVTADEGSCLPIPKGIPLEDAAALPEVLFTVWHNVFQRGGLQRGEDVLIYGGSGGIGSMAIQLAHLYGSTPYAVVSSVEKAAYCLQLGAHKVVNYRNEDVLATLHSNSIDLILDSVGGLYLDINLNLLRPDGRLVYINAMEGGHPPLDIKKMMVKRLHITGSTLRARSYEFKKVLAEAIYQHAYPLIEQPTFQNVVRYRFRAEDAAKAHDLMDSRDFYGKIILTF